MKCPKCGWRSVRHFTREVYARKQDNTPIFIQLNSGHCNRNGCDWNYTDKYEDRLKEFGFKPFYTPAPLISEEDTELLRQDKF